MFEELFLIITKLHVYAKPLHKSIPVTPIIVNFTKTNSKPRAARDRNLETFSKAKLTVEAFYEYGSIYTNNATGLQFLIARVNITNFQVHIFFRSYSVASRFTLNYAP